MGSMSVSSCICCTFVSFGSKVRVRIFGCVTMCSAVLFVLRSRFLVYSAGSGLNRLQVVLSGFDLVVLSGG